MAHGATDGQGHPVLIPILPLDHSNKSVTSLINMAPTPKTTSRSALPTPRSLTDDIMRLAAMKQEGLLTAEEFALAKARLLGLPSARQLTILQLISRLHHAGASWEDACEPVRHELERRVALLPPAAASHQGPFPPPPEGHTAPLSTSEKAVRPVSPPRVAKSPRSTSAPRRISDELEKKPQITHALADAQASVHAEVHGDAQARREPRAPLTRTTGAVLPKVKVAVVGGQEELIQEGNATSFYALRPDPGPSLDWASALRSGAAPGRPAPSPPSTVSIASSRVGVDKSLRFSGSGSPGQATSPPGTLHGSGTGDQPKRFRELIQDEYFAVSFAAYLEGARAHELLAFFREVEAWITLEDRGTQREKAFLMYQKFLAPGAVNELNIDETSRKACFAELSTSDWNRNLFNETQGEVVSLLEAEFLPKFLRSEVGLSYSTRSRSTRKEKSQGVGQLFGRLSLSNNNASDTRPSNKIEPRSGKDGFVSPPVSPKGPAMSQSSSGPVVPRKGTGTSNGTTSPRRAVSPRKALSPGRSKSPEPITRP